MCETNLKDYNFLHGYQKVDDVDKLKAEIKRLHSRINQATDEIAEVLADYDLSNEELIEVRDTIQLRLDNAQKILLYGEKVE